MALLFRIFLVGLLVYLVLRAIASFGARSGTAGEKAGGERGDKGRNNDGQRRGISRDIGEYVDYEEVDKP